MHHLNEPQVPAAAPDDEQFQTLDQIAEYRSGNSIECLLCGKHFQVLNSHLIKMHEIDPFEYRRRFGIPASQSLASKRFRLQGAENFRHNTKALAALELYRKTYGPSDPTGRPRRAWVPATLSSLRERNKDQWVGKPYVTVPCSACGADTVVRESWASHPARCLNCVSRRSRSSKISYWRHKFLGRKARLTPEELSCFKTPFQTKEEVDAYLSGDTIDCLICGRRLQRLNMHLKLAHEMSQDDYRMKFGIPFTRALYSVPARITMRICFDEPRISAFKAEAEKHRTTPPKKSGPRHPREVAAPSVREHWRKIAQAGAARFSRQTTAACPKCGAEFQTSAGHAAQRRLCLDCTTPASRQSRLRKMALKAEGPQGPPAHYDVPFETMEQVDAYLSGDKIQCLLCGERMQTLHKHLRHKHGVTSDDYRIQFGIPYKRGLQSAKHKALASASKTPADTERILRAGRERKAAIAAGAKTPRSIKPVIPAVRDQHRKRNAAGGPAAHTKIPIPCVKCGIPVQTILLRATRPVYCVDCTPSPYMRLWHARKKAEAQPSRESTETK